MSITISTIFYDLFDHLFDQSFDLFEIIEILLNKIGPNNDTLASDLLVAYNALIE